MHVQALMKQWCIECRTYYYNEQYVNTPAIIIPIRTYEASRGAGAQSVTVNETGPGFNLHSGNKIFI